MVPNIIGPSAVSALDHFRVAEPEWLFSLTMATAILIDGDFFLRCNHAIYYIDVTVREETSAKSSNPFWIFQRPNTTYDS